MTKDHYKPESYTLNNNLINKIAYSRREKYKNSIKKVDVLKNLSDLRKVNNLENDLNKKKTLAESLEEELSNLLTSKK
ncbi:hypothetical protein NUSPORA_02060 [Nucleospora cyclopteri]